MNEFKSFELLSIPISTNNLYNFFSSRKGPNLTSDANKFYKSIVKEINEKRLKLEISGLIELKVEYYCCDRRGRDADNILKSLQDGLKKAEFYSDDKQIVRVNSSIIKPPENYLKIANRDGIQPFIRISYRHVEEIFDERYEVLREENRLKKEKEKLNKKKK